MSPTGRKPAPESEAGKRLLETVRSQVTDYEAAFGALPIWFRELDPAHALPLMASLLRVGLKLPPQELLLEDMRERDLQGRARVGRKP